MKFEKKGASVTYRSIFEKHKIEFCAPLPFASCRVRNERLLTRVGFEPKSVIMFLMPYRSEAGEKRNISLYAVPKDYHIYAKRLFSELLPELRSAYGADFCGFADHSPVAEADAACRAGLGVKGDNGLLINRKYGSYCFIGEVLTDAVLPYGETEAAGCLHCGKCAAACPAAECGGCLSEISQKKGVLSEPQKAALKKYGVAWGCDICQDVCPMNAGAALTPIDFFKEDRVPFVTYASVSAMDEKEFSERAFSWRGRSTVLRNLSVIEEKDAD